MKGRERGAVGPFRIGLKLRQKYKMNLVEGLTVRVKRERRGEKKSLFRGKARELWLLDTRRQKGEMS